jgi:hypothetical protein
MIYSIELRRFIRRKAHRYLKTKGIERALRYMEIREDWFSPEEYQGIVKGLLDSTESNTG